MRGYASSPQDTQEFVHQGAQRLHLGERILLPRLKSLVLARKRFISLHQTHHGEEQSCAQTWTSLVRHRCSVARLAPRRVQYRLSSDRADTWPPARRERCLPERCSLAPTVVECFQGLDVWPKGKLQCPNTVLQPHGPGGLHVDAAQFGHLQSLSAKIGPHPGNERLLGHSPHYCSGCVVTQQDQRCHCRSSP